MSIPLVSICCITYNHKNYIKDAIESFLQQKTSFPFEIIIHDDASTDGTQDIILQYQKKYPNLIFPILQKENQWSKKIGSIYQNFVYPIAKGKYIAVCEGDDFWIDHHKLQKQIDFLENNPDFGLTCTQISFIDENNNPTKKHDNYLSQEKQKHLREITFFNLLTSNSIYTLTACFKKDLAVTVKPVPHSYDYWVWLQFSTLTKMYKLPDVTASYRVHNTGLSSQKGFFDKRFFLAQRDGLVSYVSKKNETNPQQKAILFKTLLMLLSKRQLKLSEKRCLCSLFLKHIPLFTKGCFYFLFNYRR